MRTRILAACFALSCVLAFLSLDTAEAKTHHASHRHHVSKTHHHRHHVQRHHHRSRNLHHRRGLSHSRHHSFRRGAHFRHRATSRHGRYARPAAWCGWYARRALVSVDPGPQYNLARAWASWGHSAGGPRVGAIVVWHHHVGKIVGREGRKWVVRSGNDGHAVRTRPRSLAGAIAFRM